VAVALLHVVAHSSSGLAVERRAPQRVVQAAEDLSDLWSSAHPPAVDPALAIDFLQDLFPARPDSLEWVQYVAPPELTAARPVDRALAIDGLAEEFFERDAGETIGPHATVDAPADLDVEEAAEGEESEPEPVLVTRSVSPFPASPPSDFQRAAAEFHRFADSFHAFATERRHRDPI
jgi:hypothetical protein